MKGQLRDSSVGAGMLSYLALTKDEPPQLAIDYLLSAQERLARAVMVISDPHADPEARKQAYEEVTGIRLLLIGLAAAADPTQPTPVNIRITPRRGRPKRNIVKIGAYRLAAHQLLARKGEGYDAAAREIAKETGLDRTEIEAWASHLERQMAAFAVEKIAFFFRSAI